MKYISIIIVSIFSLILISCKTNIVAQEAIKAKIYSNNFKFVVTEYDSRKTVNIPAGTGRILSSNLPVGSKEDIGVSVNPDELTVNLPLDDKLSTLKKSNLKLKSQDFEVARTDMPNGNILLNFFLKDQSEINLIKMEVRKDGIIDASIEGPSQTPLLYVGELRTK